MSAALRLYVFTQLHERPQLSLLLNSIKRGEVANLLVYTRCRLARNVEQYMEIYELLQEHQINVLFGADNEPAVLYTPEGALIEELMAAIALIY
ncbi:UNVERIFIED_CONTAM: DNA invertase Pin-like site-specific DNA recombinase [Brevibacillus sp. OAP136]